MTSAAAAPGSDPFLAALLEGMAHEAVIVADEAGLVIGWSEGAGRLLGWTAAEMLGRPAHLLFAVPDREEPDGAGRCWRRRKDGTIVGAERRGRPVRGPDGATIGRIEILRDRAGPDPADTRHDDDSEFLRAVLASSPDCIKLLDLEGRLMFMSEGGLLAMEVDDFAAIAGCPWPGLWIGDGNLAAIAALDAARSGTASRFRAMADTAKGSPRWWDVQVAPILGCDGRPERLLSVSRDVTMAVRDEEQARLLADELQHRVKNTLSMVQAIVRQTLRNATDIGAALEAIDMRLVALGRAHGMLTQDRWTTSDLRSIVAAALGSHDDGTGRFRIDGPHVPLDARASMSLALLVHELATNATKYGALSVPDGRVEIAWATRKEPAGDGPAQDDATTRLELLWRERHGPPVSPPARRGFGSRLIEHSLAGAIDGTAVIEFLNEGVCCRVAGLVATPSDGDRTVPAGRPDAWRPRP